MIELENILPKAAAVVYKTGEFIRAQRNKVQGVDIEVKDVNSLVSYVDKSAEEELVKGLRDVFHLAGFITEENTVSPSEQEWTWIIDPLDGTTNFLHDIPIFSISVALAHRQEVVLGVVYEIVGDEMFTAFKGGGAFLNGKPIRVSQDENIADIVVATGYPYAKEKLSDEHFAVLRKVLESTRGMRRLGSAAVDLSYVACGRFGMYYEIHLNPWDVAAGGLLVKEAGGVVTEINGSDHWISGKSILAYGPKLAPGVLRLVEEFKNYPS